MFTVIPIMNVNIRHHLLSVPVSGWLWLTQADQWEMTFSCCSSYLLRLLIILSSHLSPLDSASLTTHQLGGRCERVTAFWELIFLIMTTATIFRNRVPPDCVMCRRTDWNVWNVRLKCLEYRIQSPPSGLKWSVELWGTSYRHIAISGHYHLYYHLYYQCI